MLSTIIVTILLFIFPIILIAILNSLFQNFELKNIVITLNKSLLIQIAFGIILYLSVQFLPNFNDKYESNIISDTIIETSIYYILIGMFYYLPCLILLNLITKSWKNISRN